MYVCMYILAMLTWSSRVFIKTFTCYNVCMYVYISVLYRDASILMAKLLEYYSNARAKSKMLA